MSKNASKIVEALKEITHRDHELMSGTVVQGSVDTSEYTCNVLLTDMEDPIEGVMLNTILANGNGFIQVPADNSDVLIGSIDGSGQYTLIKCSKLAEIIVIIGSTKMTIQSSGVQLNDGSLGGLVKVIDLTTKLNNLENKLNSIINAWHTFATTYIAGSPVTYGGPASLTDVSGDLILTTRSDIEDIKMTH